MLDKLKAIELRYQEVEARLADNATYSDPALAARLNQEQRELQPLMETYRAYLRAQKTLEESQGLFPIPTWESWPGRSSARPRPPCPSWRTS